MSIAKLTNGFVLNSGVAEAVCPVDTIAVSGGYSWSGDIDYPVFVFVNERDTSDSSNRSWLVQGSNPSPDINATLTAFAYCADSP